ncbi:hypothetical protein [Pararhizobium gei]|uniref:hypothetical protein n=1 Tax=Pararhizobium gei TaxID=1395951 RepID=UPI0023DCC5FD|nr:hypothetical protein [Rhizobium gei]
MQISFETMTRAEIKPHLELAKERLTSLRAMLDAGYEIGNAEAFVTRAEIKVAAEHFFEISTEYQCAA